MTSAPGGRRPARAGRLVRGGVAGVAVGVAALAGLTGCTSASTPPPPTPTSSPAEPDPSAVVSSLGAVPVPPSHPPVPTPSAAAGHPVLSAAGAPVAVSFGSTSRALVTVLGPEQADQGAGGAPGAGPENHTRAALTLQIRQLTGTVTVRAEELSSRDETGHTVELVSTGPAAVTARAGRTATLAVLGEFDSGSAQVTWRHHGRVLAVWAFTVELD